MAFKILSPPLCQGGHFQTWPYGHSLYSLQRGVPGEGPQNVFSLDFFRPQIINGRPLNKLYNSGTDNITLNNKVCLYYDLTCSSIANIFLQIFPTKDGFHVKYEVLKVCSPRRESVDLYEHDMSTSHVLIQG